MPRPWCTSRRDVGEVARVAGDERDECPLPRPSPLGRGRARRRRARCADGGASARRRVATAVLRTAVLAQPQATASAGDAVASRRAARRTSAESTPLTKRPESSVREALRQLDRLVEHDGDRHVGTAEQLEAGDPHDRDGRSAASARASSPSAWRGDRGVEARRDGPRRPRTSSRGQRVGRDDLRARRVATARRPSMSASYSRISARSRASVRSSPPSPRGAARPPRFAIRPG